MAMVLYTDAKGKQHCCSEEDWQNIDARQKKFKVKSFTYSGPFEPVKVPMVPVPANQTITKPEELKVGPVKSSKQGAASSPSDQKA